MAGLSPSAVKAANDALWAAHPELHGRSLTSDSKDAALRAEWMKYYKGEPAGAPVAKPVGAPCATCASVTAVDEREIQEEANRLRQLLIELSQAKGPIGIYDALINMFAFDSKWHDSQNNQRLFSFRGRTMSGSNLNYYFQGVIWSWLDMPQSTLSPFVMSYKMMRWQQILSPEARWAADQGYRDGLSLLSPTGAAATTGGSQLSPAKNLPKVAAVEPLRQMDGSIYAPVNPANGTLAPTHDDMETACVATAILMLERRTNPNITIRVYDLASGSPLPGYVNYAHSTDPNKGGVVQSKHLNDPASFSLDALTIELPSIVEGPLNDLHGEQKVRNHAIVITSVVREKDQIKITYLDPYAAQATPLTLITTSDSDIQFPSQGGTRVLKPREIRTYK